MWAILKLDALGLSHRLHIPPKHVSLHKDPGCMVEGCTGKHWGRGYCHPHYNEMRAGKIPPGGNGKLEARSTTPPQ
jgi:hypothetical protein